jgi:hypothetical protein
VRDAAAPDDPTRFTVFDYMAMISYSEKLGVVCDIQGRTATPQRMLSM